jgi:hypothetical protein
VTTDLFCEHGTGLSIYSAINTGSVVLLFIRSACGRALICLR